MKQMSLFKRQERFEAFLKFHRDNPEVFNLFWKFSAQALKSKRKRFGARMIGERMRWYTTIETDDPDFKLNNNHLPYYARLLMLMMPSIYGEFFERRDAHFDVDDETLLREAG